ncbi:MAG TPA: flagellar biosynthetic protein FliQ [Kofleriaceae bacterium]|nr:flagellar biosynthetic protein FliQ [Kofleriaceae bacterium]
MSPDSLLDLWRAALLCVITVSAPFLVAGLAVGLTIAVIQTATQLQESVLTFVPKLAAALVVLALAGHWMLDKLGNFTIAAFTAQNQPSSDLAADLQANSPIQPAAGP